MRRHTLGRWAAVATLAVVAAALAVLVAPSPAWARVDPPDVSGLSIPAAQQALQAWDKSVVITYLPAINDLPRDIDRSTVVATRATWLNPVTIDPEPPAVRVTLGTRVPDLAGLGRTQTVESLATHGLKLVADPAQVPDRWVVRSQRPLPGTLVEFGLPVTAVFVSVPIESAAPPELPKPPGRSVPVVVLIAGGSGLGLGLLVLLSVLALRRASRRRTDQRRTDQRRTPPAADNIEVRGYHGQPVGPELTEPGPGVSLSVRLEPHYDPGTFRVEEGRR